VGLYIETNYFKADPDTGRIVVPFGRNKWTGKVLMVVDTFAQVTEFTREDESYKFYASFVLHNESLVMGF